MSHKQSPADPAAIPTEGELREQLAAYFLSMPPLQEQTPVQRREYLRQLDRLGRLERQEVLQAPGAARPLVWGNPVPLLQALLTASQRLGAGLGQPLLLFPAKETAIGCDTLLHPRLLSVGLMGLLRAACIAAPRQPVWVRLREQSSSLAVAVTAAVPFADPDTLAVVKECTRLHGGSLVLCENTVSFSCGQVSEPPPGIRLYCCPTEEDLLRDTLSPVWSGFYAGIYSALVSSGKTDASETPSTEGAAGEEPSAT